MDVAPGNPAPSWKDLQARLAGSFTARARGLLAADLLLSGSEGEFGWIESHGPSGAEVTAGPLSAVIEHTGNARYRMLTDGVPALAARPTARSADSLEIRLGERAYEARTSFFRNTAEARSPRGEEIVRLKGNLTGRRYEVVFDPEAAGALPVAILLLHHTITHRGRAFRTG